MCNCNDTHSVSVLTGSTNNQVVFAVDDEYVA